MGLYHSDLVGDQDEHGNFHLTRDLAEHLHFEFCCQLQRTVMEIRDEVNNFRAGREGPDFGEWLEEKLQELQDDIHLLDDDIDRVEITRPKSPFCSNLSWVQICALGATFFAFVGLLSWRFSRALPGRWSSGEAACSLLWGINRRLRRCYIPAAACQRCFPDGGKS